ncbi:MAG: autotransporter domain-containing protein [Planctomycetaceae bacterium]|jgi:hypothetical protein|nr:autotransporter domain-containing protein [Planctomycetaceae bacterium]
MTTRKQNAKTAKRRNRNNVNASSKQTETRNGGEKRNYFLLRAIAEMFQRVPWKKVLPKIALAGIVLVPLAAGNYASEQSPAGVTDWASNNISVSDSSTNPLIGVLDTADSGGTSETNLNGHTITVGDSTPSDNAAGFIYQHASNAYAANLGSANSASGEIKVTAGSGYAVGAGFFSSIDLSSPTFGDIVNAANIHLGNISVNGAGAVTGFVANNSAGTIQLGDISVTTTANSDTGSGASGLYLTDKISGGSITTGAIKVDATNSTGWIYGVVIGDSQNNNNALLFDQGTLTIDGAINVTGKKYVRGIDIHGQANENLVINGAIKAEATDSNDDAGATGVIADSFNGTVFKYDVEAIGGNSAGIIAEGTSGGNKIVLDTSQSENLKITGGTVSIKLDGTKNELTIQGDNEFKNKNAAFTTVNAHTIDFKTNATLASGSTLTGTTAINVANGKAVTINEGQTFDELTSNIGDGATLEIGGDLTIAQNGVTNVTGADGTFHVTGAATFGGAATFDDKVELKGNTVFQGAVQQTGDSTARAAKSFTVAAGQTVDFQDKATLGAVTNKGTMKFNGAAQSTIDTYTGDSSGGDKIQVYGSLKNGDAAVKLESNDGNQIAAFGTAFGNAPQEDQLVEYYWDATSKSIRARAMTKARLQETYLSSLLLHNGRGIWQATSGRFAFLSAPTQNVYRGQTPTGYYSALWGNYAGRASSYKSGFSGNDFELRASGLQVGLDLIHSQCRTLGVMFGYEGQRSYLDSDRVKANDYYFGLYGGTVFGGGADIRGWFGYGRQSYDTTREVVASRGTFHHASFDGNTFEGTLEVGKRFHFSSCASIRPVFGVDLSRNEIDAAAEDGNASTLAIYDGATLGQAYLRFGTDARIRRDYWNLNGGLYYSVDLASDHITMKVRDSFQNTAFLNSSGLGSSLFTINFGGEYFVFQNVSLFASYYGDIYTDRAGTPYSNTLLAGLQAKF